MGIVTNVFENDRENGIWARSGASVLHGELVYDFL